MIKERKTAMNRLVIACHLFNTAVAFTYLATWLFK